MQIPTLSPHLFKTPQLAAAGSTPYAGSGWVENPAASIRCGDLFFKKQSIYCQTYLEPPALSRLGVGVYGEKRYHGIFKKGFTPHTKRR